MEKKGRIASQSTLVDNGGVSVVEAFLMVMVVVGKGIWILGVRQGVRKLIKISNEF